MACIQTQVTFTFVCFGIFNIIAAILLHFSLLSLLFQSSLMLALSIPLGFFAISLALVKRLTANELTTIVSIIMLASMLLLSSNINQALNPLKLVADMILSIRSLNYWFIFLPPPY
ncbi:hypothetical protein G4V62_16375 [Bacillaceae bacterium SIJ1]|uniref:hypothetical protein n=1 Tax=Litoribacterium kuwaitense TaxID=1398745 RepID=UPI0013EC2D16|nr:hypothetical protein [Litoribacterium kuwaitense]NGP46446.1 hypothetical protein [Litoribacterium kuwaitense]